MNYFRNIFLSDSHAQEQTYSDGTKSFSTCNLVEVVGPDAVHPSVAGLVELHDQLSKVPDSAPLA